MDLDYLIDLGDPDELIREIDRQCSRRQWDSVEAIARRCRLAVERGKTLWGVAAHAEYRLVLEAPGEIAAQYVRSPPSVAALGPLAEVLASTHQWSEVAEHLPEGPSRGVTAYECVVRGEDVSNDASMPAYVEAFELPPSLQGWEPQYPLALYKDTEATFPKPTVIPLGSVSSDASAFELIDEPEVAAAMQQLVDAWVTQSNGVATFVAVEGGAPEALLALEWRDAAQNISTADAMALMAWAGASGGFHGRRRGMSVGRARAWWAVGACGDALGDWPLHPNHVGDIANSLEWFTFGRSDADAMELGIIAVDPIDEVAFALHAHDTKT